MVNYQSFSTMKNPNTSLLEDPQSILFVDESQNILFVNSNVAFSKMGKTPTNV